MGEILQPNSPDLKKSINLAAANREQKEREGGRESSAELSSVGRRRN